MKSQNLIYSDRVVYNIFLIMKSVEGRVRKACEVYDLLDEGDNIAVGVSGGKDSIALLNSLAGYKRYSRKKYSLTALIVDPGFDNVDTDYSLVVKMCENLEIPVHIRRSNLGEVIFITRKEKNPCPLCARMRRGMLHDMTLAAGCNKIALGHHMNDAVETLFLNLFHEGRLESFKPKTYLSRKNITMIRPLVFCEESQIISYVSRNGLPVVKNRCPADGNTERENIKKFIADKEQEYPGFLKRTFNAMQRGGISGF